MPRPLIFPSCPLASFRASSQTPSTSVSVAAAHAQSPGASDPAAAQGGVYAVEPYHTQVGFSLLHLGFSCLHLRL